jgi:Ca-activated chloride channel family protein
MNATILLDHDSRAHDGRLTVRVLLRLDGEVPRRANRVPLNLSIVLDRSGSMSGDKLQAARDAAVQLVRRLWPADLVSVVAYDDSVWVVAPPSRGSDAPDLARRIGQIEAGGMTNLSGGWLKGHELTAGARHGGPNELSRVLLLTDGLANQGIIDPATLAGLLRTAAREGVSTTTIGFGEDFDERLLRTLADAGGGNTYYIERSDQAVGIFEEEIEGLLSLSAQNVAVEVRVAADARVARVHHSYPSRQTSQGLRLELGDLYAREPRMLLLELETSGPAGADQLELGTLVIRGDVLTLDGEVERREIQCPVRVLPGAGPKVEPEVRREMLLIETARAREEALERERRGDYHGVKHALHAVAEAIAASPYATDGRLMDEADDLRTMADLASPAAPMRAEDKKYLFQRAYESARSKGESYKKISRKKP